MREQGLTKFVIMVVFTSIVVFVGVFYPQNTPVEANQLNEPVGSKCISQEDWEQCAHILAEREAELDQRQDELERCQDELDEYKAGLNQRQVELDERAAKLDDQKTTLKTWEENLVKQKDLLDEEQDRLRKKEVDLAKWEQKLAGRQRFSIVVMVVGSLLAVPSVVLLIALMRQNQQTPDKKSQCASISQSYQEKRASQYRKLMTTTLVPTHNGNGRNRRNLTLSSVEGIKFSAAEDIP